ncbi:hypothetical protein [Boudabousia marimammalium]|uniref:Uncharacterized protein n=1 Tax=Boudabousia marimammalium TaxID=156892 RepID=A0A1Q5PL35_9ACTO|nr:hypothetical protein [Boudabousia marimammalium]OKL47344.1 hypothetical protein BM477_06660 [Boudabousia marimammalium]
MNARTDFSKSGSDSKAIALVLAVVVAIVVAGGGVFIYYQNTVQACQSATASYTGAVSELINRRNDAVAEIKAATDTAANPAVEGFATAEAEGVSGEKLLAKLQALVDENPVPEAKADCSSHTEASALAEKQRAIEAKAEEILVATAQLNNAVTQYVASTK